MNVLIIRYKKTLGVPEGGEKASELNRHVIASIFLVLLIGGAIFLVYRRRNEK